MISTGMDEPTAATTTRPKSLLGMEFTASRNRLNAASNQPPMTAAHMPSTTPEVQAMVTAASDMPTVKRAPMRMRENTSRPR
ncbi:hypothetical protein D3C85_1745900 [compost metagenome]